VREGELEELRADSVIGIAPERPGATLADALASRGVAVHAIGDCHTLGFIEGATNGAMTVARAIG
jgi:hypothetical protein